MRVHSAMVTRFCVRHISKRRLLKIIQVTMKHDPFGNPCGNPCRFYIHFALTYSFGPSSIVWSKLGLAVPIPPTRALEVQWSRPLILCVKWPYMVTHHYLSFLVNCFRDYRFTLLQLVLLTKWYFIQNSIIYDNISSQFFCRLLTAGLRIFPAWDGAAIEWKAVNAIWILRIDLRETPEVWGTLSTGALMQSTWYRKWTFNIIRNIHI